MFKILLIWQTQQVNMGDLYYYTRIELTRTQVVYVMISNPSDFILYRGLTIP